MFGNDDGQPAQDAATPGATPDGTLGTPSVGAVDATATVVDSNASGYGDGGYSPAAGAPAAAVAPITTAEPAALAAPPPAAAPLGDIAGADDLLQIKQQALQQLSPLVGHLEQSPEEKFRTTMMMIQASDNQDLIKEAYAAAQQIQDEKTRAQALLDIVNEINYFTQQQQA